MEEDIYNIEDNEEFFQALEKSVGLPAVSRGYTYFIQSENGGLIKIGETQQKKPEDRLAEIQGNSPEKLKIITYLQGIDLPVNFVIIKMF